MHAHDQHLLIVRAVEDTDPAALRQVACRPPKEIVLQLGCTGMLVAEDLTPLRVHPRHDVPDRAILACRVHCLEDDQHSMFGGCIVELLQLAQLPGVLGKQLLIIVFRLVERIDDRGPLLEVDLLPFRNTEVLEMDLHASIGHPAALGGNATTLAGLASMASTPMVLASKTGAVSGFGRLFRPFGRMGADASCAAEAPACDLSATVGLSPSAEMVQDAICEQLHRVCEEEPTHGVGPDQCRQAAIRAAL